MLKDYEIANLKELVNIKKIAKKAGLNEEDIILYGDYKAKIKKSITPRNDNKVVLVTATNPTPYGEGKTTVAIGLNDALNKLNENSILALREPSMGPVFGIKGGATGGGYAQVLPMEDINLHFTGDFHAITSANNLISAMIDNSIKQGNELNIDINTVCFKRTMDMNDRALREVNVALGGKINGVPRVDHFTITSACEIMAIFCLATSLDDLRRRLDKIIIGKNLSGDYVYVKDLNITGSLIALLKDAFKPNLVQSLEENPVIIHGGPFANIAHGCNSIVATNLASGVAKYTITEAGFGADLGALKFLDIVCRKNNIDPSVVVLVTTIKALKYNGGLEKEKINCENIDSLRKGLPNLEAHIKNLEKLGVNIVVTLNKYLTDTEKEIQAVDEFVSNKGYKLVVNEVYEKGGIGAIDLAKEIIKYEPKKLKPLYKLDIPLINKIEKVCYEIYNAKEIEFSEKAENKLQEFDKHFGNYPICVAKTQYSISDNPKLLGNPTNYKMFINDIEVNNGAEFITVLMGDIMTMPGLSKEPAAKIIDVDENEKIVNIF